MLYFQNEQLAKDEILAFFASHINAIKKIYEETVFQTYNQDVTYSAVTFAVQRTKVCKIMAWEMASTNAQQSVYDVISNAIFQS